MRNETLRPTHGTQGGISLAAHSPLAAFFALTLRRTYVKACMNGQCYGMQHTAGNARGKGHTCLPCTCGDRTVCVLVAGQGLKALPGSQAGAPGAVSSLGSHEPINETGFRQLAPAL